MPAEGQRYPLRGHTSAVRRAKRELYHDDAVGTIESFAPLSIAASILRDPRASPHHFDNAPRAFSGAASSRYRKEPPESMDRARSEAPERLPNDAESKHRCHCPRTVSHP